LNLVPRGAQNGLEGGFGSAKRSGPVKSGSKAIKQAAPPLRFVSDAAEAKNSESEGFRFAKRNQAFRNGGGKPLKSLRVANHDFVGSFVFNGLSAISFRRFLTIGFSVSKIRERNPS
jgi:hypothetical protein